jgi:glucokinase-like ROK family protein
MKKSATANLMRRLNRSAILNLIRTEGPIARSEIGRHLNMSLPTVMRVIDDLIQENLVRFHGSEPSGGRRRALVEFNGSSQAVIGIDLGGTKMYGTITDLTGHIVHAIRVPWGEENGPDSSLAGLYSLIEALLEAPRPRNQTLRGIGIGVPGVTLSDSGTVVWAPSLGWRDLPLKQLVTERFNLPTFVENDVNVAALGELGFGIERNTPNLVCVAIGTGIGAGIILDGKLLRGHNQGAGEIGYFLPDIHCLGQQYDEFGAFESLASGLGIAQRASKLLQETNHPLADQNITAEVVFDYARAGSDWATQIVEETVDYLSQALAIVSALLDPEAIVLGGGVAQSADLLIEPILQRIKGTIPFVPRIVASNLGSQAVVMGTIMLVLDATTGQVMVEQRI